MVEDMVVLPLPLESPLVHARLGSMENFQKEFTRQVFDRMCEREVQKFQGYMSTHKLKSEKQIQKHIKM